MRSMSVERQAGLLEHLARRRRRPHAHQGWLDADRGPVREPRERRESVVTDTGVRCQQQRGAAVDDARGVAGGHAPAAC